MRWEKEKFIMGCITRETVDKQKLGLVPTHAYSLLAAYQVGNYRLVKLRNPWGNLEWKGEFSDKSPLWTEEAKRKCGVSETDDGVFFMKLHDFVTYMRSYSVCYHKD